MTATKPPPPAAPACGCHPDPERMTSHLVLFDTYAGAPRNRVAVYVPRDVRDFDPVRAAQVVCATARRAPETWAPRLVHQVIDFLFRAANYHQAEWADALSRAVDDYPLYTVTQ